MYYCQNCGLPLGPLIVAETPGNFFLFNNQITDINVSLRGLYNDNNRHEFEVNIYGSGQKYSYHMD